MIKIKKNGAVSEIIAKLMVLNLFKISKSELCISTTGIAGPGGGSENKPVGLVYIGIYYKKKLIIKKKLFKGSRIKIQKDVVKLVFESISKLI